MHPLPKPLVQHPQPWPCGMKDDYGCGMSAAIDSDIQYPRGCIGRGAR